METIAWILLIACGIIVVIVASKTGWKGAKKAAVEAQKFSGFVDIPSEIKNHMVLQDGEALSFCVGEFKYFLPHIGPGGQIYKKDVLFKNLIITTKRLIVPTSENESMNIFYNKAEAESAKNIKHIFYIERVKKNNDQVFQLWIRTMGNLSGVSIIFLISSVGEKVVKYIFDQKNEGVVTS